MNDKLDQQLAKYLYDHLQEVKRTQGLEAYEFELNALEPSTRRAVVQHLDKVIDNRFFWAHFAIDFLGFSALAVGTFGIIYLLS